MGFCINCGQQFADGTRFCRFCGNQQPGEQLLARLRGEAQQIAMWRQQMAQQQQMRQQQMNQSSYPQQQGYPQGGYPQQNQNFPPRW